jgi:RNA polymerase sigma-70 factor (ECF subfamily)
MCAMTSILPILRSEAARDQQLTAALHRCATRDVDALRALYELIAPSLLGQLVHMLGDPDEAEEALQECFVRIWQRAGTFSATRCRPYTWLLSVARHHAIDRLRERAGSAAAEAGESPFAAGLQQLVEGQQQCLRLAYVTGLPMDEVARQLELSPAAAKSQIRRGLLALKERMPP